jgi:hypothetical protein
MSCNNGIKKTHPQFLMKSFRLQKYLAAEEDSKGLLYGFNSDMPSWTQMAAPGAGQQTWK